MRCYGRWEWDKLLLGRDGDDADQTNEGRVPTSIIVMEVGVHDTYYHKQLLALRSYCSSFYKCRRCESDVTWHDDNPNGITVEQITAKQTELQTAYNAKAYARTRATAYPADADFKEAYTEKEIGGDSTKWDAYVIAYNKVRTDNPK